jgi:hypothetical protein
MRLLQYPNGSSLRFAGHVDVLPRLLQRGMPHQLLNLYRVGALQCEVGPERVTKVVPSDVRPHMVGGPERWLRSSQSC